MQIEYLTYLKKLNNFNEWEKNYLRGLSLQEKAKQFIQLYQLKQFLNKDHLAKIHNDHLNSLIDCQKMLLYRTLKKPASSLSTLLK